MNFKAIPLQWATPMGMTPDQAKAHIALHEGLDSTLDIFTKTGIRLSTIALKSESVEGNLTFSGAGVSYATGTAAYALLHIPGMPPLRCEPPWDNPNFISGLDLAIHNLGFTFGS